MAMTLMRSVSLCCHVHLTRCRKETFERSKLGDSATGGGGGGACGGGGGADLLFRMRDINQDADMPSRFADAVACRAGEGSSSEGNGIETTSGSLSRAASGERKAHGGHATPARERSHGPLASGSGRYRQRLLARAVARGCRDCRDALAQL